MWAGKIGKWVGVLIIVVALAPRALHAATFTWDGGSAATSNWTDAANWNPDGAPANNGTADIVFGGAVRLTPNLDVPFNIQSLTFNNSSGAFVLGGGTLTLGAGGITNNDANTQTVNMSLTVNAPQTWSSAAGLLNVGGNINLNGLLTANTFFSMTISGGISGAGGLTKEGIPTLSLQGALSNGYTGTTTIDGGTLALGKTSSNGAIAGNIILGDGVGIDTLRLDASTQINDSSAVTINSSGVFDLQLFSEAIGSLTMTGGSVSGGGSSSLLFSTGGVTTNASATTALINAGTLNAGAGVRTFTVADGSAPIDLDIFSSISSGTWSKNGPGTLRFSGAVGNTYTGSTTVNDGTLVLAKSGVATSINGPLIIGDGSGNDIVRLDNLGQINSASSVTINSSGLLDLNGNFQAFSSTISLNAGAIATGTSGTLRLAGNLISLANSETATISGAGTVDLFGGGRIFTVNDGPAGDDLEISAAISNGGVTKSGTGTMVFSGTAPNTYGVTFVTAGTLVLRKNTGTAAVPAQLAIGDGLGGVNSDVVRLESNEQIADNSVVQINSSGLLDVNGRTETIGPIQFSGGTINLNNGNLTILGDVSVNGTASASINGPGTLDLGGATRTFNILDDVPGVDLDISASINNGALIKSGTGTLQLSGGVSNLNTTVNQGILLLNRSSAAELSGAWIIGDDVGGVASDILRYAAANQVANNAATSITIKSTGLLDLAGFSDTLSNITLNGGTISTGAGTLTINGGTFTQNEGTFSGSLLNQATYNFNGGSINGTLTNEGIVNLNANLTVSNGLENRASLGIGIGRTLTVNGAGLRNLGNLTLDGGTLAGTATVINDFGGQMSARGTIAANFTNNGTLQTTGLLTLNNGGINFGAINIYAAQSLQLPQALNNLGVVTLFSGGIGGAGGIFNDAQIQGGGGISASVSNFGLIFANATSPLVISNLSANNASGELRVADGSVMNVINPFQSDGAISLQGANASLNGGQITNNGSIIGHGRISNSVTSTGVVRAEGGLLNFAGIFTNGGPASIQVPAGATTLFSLGLLSSGTISLTGGNFSTNNTSLNNTGVITGFGTFSSGGAGLTNNGSITFTGGFTTINGSVTNAAAHQIRVAYNPALFTGNVTNNGIFKNTATTITFAGIYTENGTFISDPADNFFSSVNIGPSGAWVGGAGDRFFLMGDLLSSSKNKSGWQTAEAELHLMGGVRHQLSVSGEDRGISFDGYSDNFGWGSLVVDAGDSLALRDGDDVSGGGLYVHELLLGGGVGQISNIRGNGLNIYYDLGERANAWLGGQTYALSGGGSISPVPEPGLSFLGMLGMTTLLTRRRTLRRQ